MAFKLIRQFIKLEASGGIILFITALLALIIDNSSWSVYYRAFFNTTFSFHLGMLTLSKPILLWVNDGFMSIFFLLVGLEIKREMFEGELNSLTRAALPAIAAVGGMVVPALVYVFFNWGHTEALRGWAIPTATDIAFSLGILALLGSRIPPSLKIFLTALAIFDDIGAIIVIAVFYTKHISMLLLFIGLGLILVLVILNRLRIVNLAAYFVVGFILWVCVLKSGVHATLAGIILAFAIPLKNPKQPQFSPLRRLEYNLHPWVAFGILPIFAFANAGVSLKGLSFSHLLSPVPLGIAAGLFIGKQIGIWLATILGVRLGLAHMPHGVKGAGVYGVSLIAGVGFTMSLFIGSLAFGYGNDGYPALVRLGVIFGSLLSGLFGYIVLRIVYSKPKAMA
ncbi:MAG: Na+/H+ antiporter NhaA [Gammaproteobacteria bacterium]|nr:Na+/H+ antiporter NhaA [Gammaproteobacteria bacterium]